MRRRGAHPSRAQCILVGVVRLRLFTSALALVIGATPLMGVLCRMDCDQPPAASRCHESLAVPDGPIVRGTHHPCDHDHIAGSPALIASSAARDSVGGLVAAVPLPALTYTLMPDAGSAVASLHGPPSSDRRSLFSRTTV